MACLRCSGCRCMYRAVVVATVWPSRTSSPATVANQIYRIPVLRVGVSGLLQHLDAAPVHAGYTVIPIPFSAPEESSHLWPGITCLEKGAQRDRFRSASPTVKPSAKLNECVARIRRSQWG